MWCHSDAAGCGGIQCPFHDLYSETFSLFYYSFVISFGYIIILPVWLDYQACWLRSVVMHLMFRKRKMQNVYKDSLRQWILCNYTFLMLGLELPRCWGPCQATARCAVNTSYHQQLCVSRCLNFQGNITHHSAKMFLFNMFKMCEITWYEDGERCRRILIFMDIFFRIRSWFGQSSEGIDQLKVLLEAVNHLTLKIIPPRRRKEDFNKNKTITICEKEGSDYNLIVIVVEPRLRQDRVVC